MNGQYLINLSASMMDGLQYTLGLFAITWLFASGIPIY